MTLETWLSFAMLATLATLTPGPAMLLAVTHGARYGSIGTIPTVSGNITGLAIMSSASAVGIGSLLQVSSDWLLVLRLVGGLYLTFLGVKLFIAASQNKNLMADSPGPLKFRNRPAHHRYAQGLAVAMSNPKAIFFITALFPQFINAHLSVWPQLLVLGLTLMTLSFAALISFAAASRKIMNNKGGRLVRLFDRATGTVFILFGIALIAGRR